MTDAPKRIYPSVKEVGMMTKEPDQWFNPEGCAGEYHLARPGQPVSTDEFLRRVFTKWDNGLITKDAVFYKIEYWNDGDFTEAMEGLE